jgi:hypothetical protein
MSGFTAAASGQTVPVEEPAAEQSGFVLQQRQADKSRQDDEETPSGFFKGAADGDQSGFSLAGTDENGSGFHLSPATTSSLFGGKWMFVHPDAISSDGATMHPAFARDLNRSLNKVIKRALEQKWQNVILQQGLIGRVAAPAPLNNALNRRIAFLANPPPGHEKGARRIIKTMGFNPDNAEVKAQLQTLRSHSMSPEEVLRMVNTPQTPTGPAIPSPANP